MCMNVEICVTQWIELIGVGLGRYGKHWPQLSCDSCWDRRGNLLSTNSIQKWLREHRFEGRCANTRACVSQNSVGDAPIECIGGSNSCMRGGEYSNLLGWHSFSPGLCITDAFMNGMHPTFPEFYYRSKSSPYQLELSVHMWVKISLEEALMVSSFWTQVWQVSAILNC